MNKGSLKFLQDLLETPSPSGFEERIQKVVKKKMSAIADSVEIDVHGNLIAAFNPDAKIRVMLAGHCDQIGAMVTHIDDSGYIYFNQIGGIDSTVMPGSNLIIHTEGGPIPGVIGVKPIHLVSAEERGKSIQLSKLWIDIGAEDGKIAKSKVKVGDPITFRLAVINLGKNRIAAPGCDDRVGVFVVMEALRLVKENMKSKRSFPVALFAVSTVQEEVGLRGARTAAYKIDPKVGIAVDVTFASDNPSTEAKQIGTVKLGEGPTIARGPNINRELEGLLIKTAKHRKLKYQPLPAPSITGTDANVIQVNKSGVAAALIGIPNRYMHSQVEIVDLRDLETAAKLIAHTVLSITSRMTFIPA